MYTYVSRTSSIKALNKQILKYTSKWCEGKFRIPIATECLGKYVMLCKSGDNWPFPRKASNAEAARVPMQLSAARGPIKVQPPTNTF